MDLFSILQIIFKDVVKAVFWDVFVKFGEKGNLKKIVWVFLITAFSNCWVDCLFWNIRYLNLSTSHDFHIQKYVFEFSDLGNV